jgi:hypothetical protein
MTISRLPGSILLMVISLAACRTGVPVVDPGSAPPEARGTLSGAVRATDGAPLGGRQITLTSVDTGAEHRTRTADSGGYTIQVPRGRYRVQVELRSGETLQEGPTDVELGSSDLDARRDFVIGRAGSA